MSCIRGETYYFIWIYENVIISSIDYGPPLDTQVATSFPPSRVGPNSSSAV